MKRSIWRKGLFVLAGGITALLVGPLLIPVPPLKGTYPARALADEDSEFIRINGVELHVKSTGQGQPAYVLLHGFGASLYTWQAVMQPFSRLGRVIAYDRPGFGLSERPLAWQGLNPYSGDAQVQLLLGLLDHFSLSKAILVGSSAGGSIAMQAALQYPQRVPALILADPAVYIHRGSPGWLHCLLASPQMRHMGPLLARAMLRHGSQLLGMAWHDPQLIPADMAEKYRKPFQVENWDKALWEFTLAGWPIDLAGKLDELKLPVLVVTGDDDRIVPTAHSVRLAGELPNASLKVIARAGHLPHEEQPGRFMEAVSEFISRLPG